MDAFSDTQPDPHPDLAQSLPREAFAEIILVLRGALPPPMTDNPADEARRDRAAMAAVAALRPENAAEGRLAAQFVAADAWALDCLRLAKEKRREIEFAYKCRAQAMSLMREAKSSLRLLLKLQAARRVVEADAEKADHAARAEHGAAGMMQEALSAAPAVPQRTAAPASGVRAVSENATNSRDARSETDAGLIPAVQGFRSSG